jgi:hypothetical protein
MLIESNGVDLSDYKEEVRGHTSKIRKIINAVEITTALREKLFDRLNEFEKHLDKDRTGWNSFLAAFGDTCEAVGDGAEKLEPAVKIFERIMGIMRKASNKPALLENDGKPLIEGPKAPEEPEEV